VSFAFVSVIDGRRQAWTMGMHVLGLRDLVMKRDDAAADDFGIADVIRYMARGDKPVENGHVLADLSGPRFTAFVLDGASGREGPELPEDGPLHNPFGRLKLVSTRDIAERN